MLISDLENALKRGAKIRILTGNYLGITQPSALYLIKQKLGAQVDLRFYNEKGRSFHPKSYIFHYKEHSEIYICLLYTSIREAAKKTDTPFLRILRDGGRSGIRVQTLEEIQEMAADRKNEPVFVDSVCTAVEFLKMTEGPVFVTTGSKELSAFLELPDWERCV